MDVNLRVGQMVMCYLCEVMIVVAIQLQLL